MERTGRARFAGGYVARGAFIPLLLLHVPPPPPPSPPAAAPPSYILLLLLLCYHSPFFFLSLSLPSTPSLLQQHHETKQSFTREESDVTNKTHPFK